MKPEEISAIAAIFSALCALFMLYLYRHQGKGFVWAKDNSLQINITPEGKIHFVAVIPLFNLGRANIRFLKLKAKMVNLKSGKVENFEQDMDEAYFPENVQIMTFQTPIYTDFDLKNETNVKGKFVIYGSTKEMLNDPALQETINKKLEEIGDTILILRTFYKDGSWFGIKIRETTISLVANGYELTYLSKERKKELTKLFS